MDGRKVVGLLLLSVSLVELCLADVAKDFLTFHNCEFKDAHKVEGGFANYKMNIFSCQSNVFPSVYRNATCQDYCIDPEDSKKLPSGFRPVPIYGCVTFTIRKGRTKELKRIPSVFGCRCILDASGTFEATPPECTR